MQEDQWEKPLVQEGVGPSITLKTTAAKMEPTLLIALLYNQKMYKPNTRFLHNENIWAKEMITTQTVDTLSKQKHWVIRE